jgi:hypothetical protein
VTSQEYSGALGASRDDPDQLKVVQDCPPLIAVHRVQAVLRQPPAIAERFVREFSDAAAA